MIPIQATANSQNLCLRCITLRLWMVDGDLAFYVAVGTRKFTSGGFSHMEDTIHVGARSLPESDCICPSAMGIVGLHLFRRRLKDSSSNIFV